MADDTPQGDVPMDVRAILAAGFQEAAVLSAAPVPAFRPAVLLLAFALGVVDASLGLVVAAEVFPAAVHGWLDAVHSTLQANDCD